MNQTDLDLLDLAAKAAGYKKYYSHYLGRDSFVTYDDEYYSEVYERRVVGEKTLDWNPLVNYGDALMLADKLGLCLDLRESEAWVGQYPIEQGNNGVVDADVRRAIVLVAAEIGRNMI